LDPHRAYEKGSLKPPHKLTDVVVPPHLPDTPDVREDLRMYYDEIGRLDQYVGKVTAELEAQGVADNTVIIFMSDNGRPFPRDKTSLYDGGIKTPFIVKWPGKLVSGAVSDSLISSVDLATTITEIAGVEGSDTYEGVSFVPVLDSPVKHVRKYVFGEDHWHDYEDHGRSINNQHYKLIRNDYNDLAATPSADAGRSLTWQSMLKLYKQGKLNKVQRACFQVPRPKWELYALKADPDELNNLVSDPKYAAVLKELKAELNKWSIKTGDFMPSKRTPDEFDRVTGEPKPAPIRLRPRPNKKNMFGTYGKY
jgi:N-sulfoglucosamine sulfohydrolase